MASAYLATTCPQGAPCRVEPAWKIAAIHPSAPPAPIAGPRTFTPPMDSGWTAKSATPQRYVIGWPSGVVKVGSTIQAGTKRYETYLRRGAHLIHATYYELDDSPAAEAWLQREMSTRWPMAFACRHEAVDYFGPSGAGWSECFHVPVERWVDLVGLVDI